MYIYIRLWVCCGLLGRQADFGMTWLVWRRGGCVKVCNVSMRCLVRVLWEHSSVGRRNGFIIWLLEGRPVQAFESFWRDVLRGRLVESVDYLLSCQSAKYKCDYGLYRPSGCSLWCETWCRGGQLREEAGGGWSLEKLCRWCLCVHTYSSGSTDNRQ